MSLVTEPTKSFELTPEDKQQLLLLARQAIEEQFAQKSENIDSENSLSLNSTLKSTLNSRLTRPAATFVTLYKAGELRGCIGSLEARQALYLDIMKNARAAAFSDPRFPPLDFSEINQIRLSISVLTEHVLLDINNEQELLAKLEFGKDGLILEEGSRRATFLPSVWSHFSDKHSFVEALKCKAGWTSDYWSTNMKCFTYQSLEFSENDKG